MIKIFHGENIELSRKAFIEAIAKSKVDGVNEVVRLNGAEIVQSDLIQALESQSLFGGDRIVVIEGLFSRRISKEKDLLISYLSSSIIHHSSAIIIWEGKKILATGLKKFTGKQEVEIKEFKISGLLYKFLDQIIPGNGRPASLTFNSLIIEEPAELVFYFLVKRVTELISGEGYDDWRRQKLIEQASKWSGKGLTNFHRRLTEIDEAIKTGSTPSGLPSHLDIALLNL